MKLPPFLLAATVLFWGWQSNQWSIATALIALFEAPRLVNVRLQINLSQCQRIVTACLLLLAALAVFLFVKEGAGPAILRTLQWSPVFLAPLALALLYGGIGQVDPQALFALPGQAALQDTDVDARRMVNLGYGYFALWLLAASVANQSGIRFFIGLIALSSWALWHHRPRDGAPLAWAGVLIVALAGGAAISAGLFHLQQLIEEVAGDWITGDGVEDPARTSTSLGHIGKLKLSDAIILRITPAPLQPPPPLPILLMTASYNAFSSPSWLAVSDTYLSEIKSEANSKASPDNSAAPASAGTPMRWNLMPPMQPTPRTGDTTHSTLDVATTSSRDTALLALPNGARQLGSHDIDALQRNRIGTTQARLNTRRYGYALDYAPGGVDVATPARADMTLPPRERDLFLHLALQLQLTGKSPEQILAIVKAYFADNFSYNLVRNGNAINQSAMEDFMLRNHSGHCEHFASATVLLLRAAGIPALYAVGYSVQEPSRFGTGYVARKRDAHAWTRAYINGAWQDFDTTPAAWPGIEADNAAWWEPIQDTWSWLLFKVRAMGDAGHPPLLYAIGVFALAWLWRKFSRSNLQLAWLRRKKVGASDTLAAPMPASAFYEVEHAIAARGLGRVPNQMIGDWLAQIRPQLGEFATDELARIAALHYRYRFGPTQPDAAQHVALTLLCRDWLARFATADLDKDV